MGLDCHKNFSQVTARDDQGSIAWRARLDHGDRPALRERLRSWPKVPVILECTFGWGWMSDELMAAGQAPHLANSRKVAAWRTARGLAKSNTIDSDLLSELWKEQSPRWWKVWLAPAEVRDQREQLRYRMSLVAQQTQIKNRVHALIQRHGIVHGFSDLFGVKGRRFLEQLADESDATLRDSARRVLRGWLELRRLVREQIAAITSVLKCELRGQPVGGWWRSLPGISWVLAYTLVAEVGDLSRFRSSRHLCSYSLLVPVAYDSGDESDDKPIGRHVGQVGRRTLKWAFIAAARHAVRRSAYFRALFDRRTDGGKRDRNRGYIAVAHELCRAGFSCVRNQRAFTEQRPGAIPSPNILEKEPPGEDSKKSVKKKDKAKRASRPGTGRSGDLLVDAEALSRRRTS
jgi:transposase